MFRTALLAGVIVSLPVSRAAAQAASGQHAHHMHMAGPADSLPTQGGQAAFAAMAEIVRLLEADPATDWSRVTLEGLRQHLIDMNAVTVESAVATTPIEGGIEAVVTGNDRVAAAVRRMARAHAASLAEAPYRMTVFDVPGGALVRIVALPGAPPSAVARIRGLGFIGILASGNHHAAHHLAMARGASMGGHIH